MTSVDGLPGDWECVTVSLMGQTDFDYGYNDQNSQCFGMLVCPHCGKAVMCSDVQTGEQKDMTIPRNESSGSGTSYRNRPSGGGQSRSQRGGYPQLKAVNITGNREPAVIRSARVEPNPFRQGDMQTSLKIEYRGQFWLFYLRANSPLTDTLCAALGDDESRWIDVPIEVYSETDPHSGTSYVRMEVRNETPTSQPRKK